MKISIRSVLLAVVLAAVASPVSGQQGVGANYETRLSTLEEELRTINGQVEQLGFAIRRLDQNNQRLQMDYDQRLTKLESNVNSLTTEAATRAAQPVPSASAPEGSLGGLKTQRDGRVTGAVNAPVAPVLPDAPAEATMTPQEQYENAFGLLRQAKYDEAEKAFKDFIDNNPKDKLLDNAKYWHAETLYVRGRFAESSAGFADAYQQNTQGTKAPDSLLKLSMSLAALNKTPEACTALAQLKLKYPNASVTVKNRANEQRAKLKCAQ